MNILRKIHPFYLIFSFLVSFLVGAVIFASLSVTFLGDSRWLVASVILLGFFLSFPRRLFMVLSIISGILLSGYIFSNFNLSRADFSRFIGRKMEIKGVVIEDIDEPKLGEKRIKLELSNFSKNGKHRLFITLKTDEKIRRSDEIVIFGKISKGFGEYSGSVFRAKLISVNYRDDYVRDLRDIFASKIKKFIKNPEVDLGLGYLLGQKNSLPQDLEKTLRIAGLTHIVVASGYNLTVLVNFCRRRFSKVSKRFSAIMMTFLVCAFVLVVGFTPSMTRAGVVAIFGIIAWYFGRKFNAYFLLSLVAVATLLISPSNIFSLGWQLSFASFFGVLVLSPALKRFLFEDSEKISGLAGIFFETLSAQIMTLPIIALSFGKISILSILVNLIILPSIPFAMFFVFFTGISSIVSPFAAPIFGFVAEKILSITIIISEFFAEKTEFYVDVKLELTGVILYYIAIFAFLLYTKNKSR